MNRIGLVVEGYGEVEALPVLVRRLLVSMNRWDLAPGRPLRTGGRGKLVRDVETFVGYAADRPENAAILVLLDADKDCASELAMSLAERLSRLPLRQPAAVVCAKCEYEAWFLASLPALAGTSMKGGASLPAGLTFPGDVEAVRDAKGWLTERFPPGRAYKETTHQAPMSELLDIEEARRRSRSFRRLCTAVEQLVSAIDSGQSGVTPLPRQSSGAARTRR